MNLSLKLPVIALTISVLIIGCEATTGKPIADPVKVPKVDACGTKTIQLTAGLSNGTRAAANAGGNQSVALPETRLALNATGTGATAQWTQVSGPITAMFKSEFAPQTMVMADQPGEYVFELRVSDCAGGVATDQARVTVKPNPVVIGVASTPLDHLQSINRPAFKKGNTLLPLSQSSCGIAEPIRLEMMRHWGYSGQFNANTSTTGLVAQEMKSKPGAYPLELTYGNLYGIFDNYTGRDSTQHKLAASTYVREADGTIYLEGGRALVSPAAPDSAFIEVGAYLGAQAARVEAALNQPVKLVTNAGEYGLWLIGDANPDTRYGRDAAVMAAKTKSGLGWYDYISQQKARQEHLIKEGILGSLTRGRPVYSWYGDAYGPERGSWYGWRKWQFIWEQFIGPDKKPLVSDYSSPQMYYNFFNSGWSGVRDYRSGGYDALTQALKDASGAIRLGQRNIYPWVSNGWDFSDSNGVSDTDLYMGAMKVYYTAGALGAVSGYFTCDGVRERPIFLTMYNNTAAGANMPTQIKGLYALGEVHALFSHLEDFLRDGDLLEGSNLSQASNDGEIATPAMEFPADGETTDLPSQQFGATAVTVPTARVLVRKMTRADRWLITAWANTGNDRDITTTVPRLGKLSLKARRAGSVYTAEFKGGKLELNLIDVDGMNPTRTLFP